MERGGKDSAGALEQFPLAPLDDYLVHQTPDPIRVVATTDPRFYDRHWCVMHDEVGDVLLAIGGSLYPNLGTAEAYAIVNVRGDHRAVRAHCPLEADRTNLHIGPIRPTIVEGLREWHFDVVDAESEIAIDLTWRDITRQIYDASYASLARTDPPGSQRHVTAGFEGFGTATGTVRVSGETFTFTEGKLNGSRDRHWGIGRGVGGPNMHPGRRGLKAGWRGGNWIRIGDLAVWGRRVFYPFGDPRPGSGRVVDVQRRLRFEENSRLFTEGEIDLTLDDGRSFTVGYERLGHQTIFMRSAMYGGSLDGVHHGAYLGPGLRVHRERHDVTELEARLALRGLDEHHCRIQVDDQTATGILQPLEPDAYEACLRGEPGWSFL